jgi:hypothetical protein
MAKPKYLLNVSICFNGDALDPAKISELLGVTPTTSLLKGEKRSGRLNREYVSKIGVWILVIEKDVDTIALPAIVEELVEKIGAKRIPLSRIPDVEDAYVDVFIATTSRSDGEGTCEFELSAQNIAALNALGLPIRFTVAVTKP